jgi:hypothetical protein
MVASILVAAVALVTLSARKQSRAPLRIGLSFTGYSNDAAGIRFATFALTNHSVAQVLEWGVYRIQSQHQTEDAIAYNQAPLRSTRLGPGQGEAFALAAPNTPGPWRIQGYCSRVGLRQRLNDVVSESFLPERLRGVPAASWPCSEWVNE